MDLVIAEKPSVAMSIAGIIGAENNCNGYMEGNGYIVTWCIGHLIELAEPDKYREEWKKWSYDSLPVTPEHWKYQVKEDTKGQYKTVKSLLNDSRVDNVICATDAGREGELIFRLVYEMAGCTKNTKRLWISSMEENAIREGFSNLKPDSEYDNLYYSALCRQKADWLVGINGTRLFTVLYGNGKILKLGRVQTPTLSMLVEREEQIRNFVKKSYYKAHIIVDGIDAVSERMDDRTAAEKVVNDCKHKSVIVAGFTKEEKSTSPPKLFDLTSLQREANRIYGFTSKQTSDYAQNLYEKKLITYPRTDARYLSDDMEDTARSVIEAIFASILPEENIMFNPNIKRILNSKKVTDHYAIIPTKKITGTDMGKLPDEEKKILYMVALRLICATALNHTYQSVNVSLLCGDNTFKATGTTTINNGWKDFQDIFIKLVKGNNNDIDDDDESSEKQLPEMYEGQVFSNAETKLIEHMTQPPMRYTEDRLLKAMETAGMKEFDEDAERKGLGTSATRAEIIEKLVKDGFAVRDNKKNIIPTEAGINLITILPDEFKTPRLTAEWENMLALISKGEYSKDTFMSEIETMVNTFVNNYNHAEERYKNVFKSDTEALGKCPNCGSDIIKGKYGAYCQSKCGMNVGRAMGAALSDADIKSLLQGKRIFVKNLKNKAGKTYDAYLKPVGIEDYSYVKDGNSISGKQWKFEIEFPKRR